MNKNLKKRLKLLCKIALWILAGLVVLIVLSPLWIGPVAKTAANMRTASFATTLNSSAFTYDASVNDGYPIHTAYLEFDLSGGVYTIIVDETLGVHISGGILYLAQG